MVKKHKKITGYEAIDKFLNRKITGKPMGMSDEDEAIYDTENWINKHKSIQNKKLDLKDVATFDQHFVRAGFTIIK